MSDFTARTKLFEPKGSTVVSIRLDLPTAKLLHAAAVAEGFPRVGLFLRQAVRAYARQSDRMDPQLRDELVDRIAGQNIIFVR